MTSHQWQTYSLPDLIMYFLSVPKSIRLKHSLWTIPNDIIGHGSINEIKMPSNNPSFIHIFYKFSVNLIELRIAHFESLEQYDYVVHQLNVKKSIWIRYHFSYKHFVLRKQFQSANLCMKYSYKWYYWYNAILPINVSIKS